MPRKGGEDLIERPGAGLRIQTKRQDNDVARVEGARSAGPARAQTHGADDRRSSDVATEQILARGQARCGSEVEAWRAEAECV